MAKRNTAFLVRKAVRKKRKFSDVLLDVIINTLLVIAAIAAIYPLWNVLISSVSNTNAISNGEVILWPVGFNLSAYEKMFAEKQIWVGFRNSVIYTTAACIMDFVVTLPCAYALSRRSLPGRKGFMYYFTLTMYFSGGTIPLFLLISKLGWVDTPLALIIPSCTCVFELVIVRNFFEHNISEALFDAARIDGMGFFKFFVKIALPLSKAILAVFFLYRIQAHWNAYLGARMYLYSPNLKTLQQVIQAISAKLDTSLMEDMTSAEIVYAVQQKQLLKYAVVIVSALPLAIIYPFMQRYFVQGVMVGAVKE